MAEKLFQQVEQHDLLEPGLVGEILDEVITQGSGRFVLRGSLADYTLSEFGTILNFERSGNEFEFELSFDWPDDLESGHGAKEERRVRDSFMRAGIAHPVNLSNAMTKLRQTDDVIISIDTNVILDCAFSAHLLDEIYDHQYPNWILVAVPKLVMAEIENKANAKIKGGGHQRIGWPSYSGRIGNRGLQELMALDTKDEDHPGLALMTVGELNQNTADIASKGNWLLDSEIRQQFHKFLSEISFHKGTYFLSQDRVNVMMSGTEGAEGLYLQKPAVSAIPNDSLDRDDLTQLIYELCVQFGTVELSRVGDDDVVSSFSIFWPGKQVADWRESNLRLEAVQQPP